MFGLSWELFFSMFCMLCMKKESSLNLQLMIYGNYVEIMVMLMTIYVCMSLSDMVVKDHDCFILTHTHTHRYIMSSRLILVEE